MISTQMPIVKLNRFQHVKAALDDARFSSQLEIYTGAHFPADGQNWRQRAVHVLHRFQTRPQQRAIADLSQHWMVFSDPPSHTRMRAFVSAAFAARVAAIQGRVQAIADQLLARARANGGMKLLDDWGFPLAMLTIGELLGLPPADHAHVRQWFANPLVLFGQQPACSRRELVAGGQAIEYFSALVAERRKHPQDDLISELIAGRDAHGGLSEAELVATSILLLIAGYETMQRLLAIGLLQLIEQPECHRDLVRDRVIMRSAVEELVRSISPLPWLRRRAASEIELEGVRIPQGTLVHLDLYAANHDPAQFAQPNQLNLRRAPNPHLAFGRGHHICSGARLARLEAERAFKGILQHPPRLARGSAPASTQIPIGDLRQYELTFG